MSRTLIIAVAVLAVFACAFATAETPAAAVEPRFAEAEMEDQAVVAEQQAEFESTLAADEIEDEAEEEEEEAEEEEESDEAEDESSDEEAEEEESEAESEEEEESEEEADEESEEEADEESEDESEEEESETEFVLAELQDSAVSTGFMEMTAKFVPTAPRTADHLVHSASSETAAIAKQHYMAGHADGFMAASSNAEEDESEDGEEALVETEAEADTENPVYVASSGAQYYGSYPTYAGVTYTPAAGIPVPPQLPTWLPPPPYITPAPVKGGDD